MDFNGSRPIYIQIADNICDRVLSGELKAGDRLASVREWGASIGVNPNTVARSYELLTERGVIFNQRGIGFFVAENALEKVHETERRRFLEEDVPAFAKRAELLGINLAELFN